MFPSWSFNLTGETRSSGSTQSTSYNNGYNPSWTGAKCKSSSCTLDTYSSVLSRAIQAGTKKSSFPVDPNKPIKSKSVLGAAIRTMQK